MTATSQNAQRIERVLASSLLFKGLDPALIADIARTASVRQLERTEHLWRAGDAAKAFAIILTGLVKIVRRMPDGTEAILAIFGPRESVGDVAVIGRRTFPADAVVASEQAEILRVEAEPILAVMDRKPDVAATFHRTMVSHTQLLHAKIGVMSAGAVPKRLATLLLSLAERFGDEHEDGTVTIPVAISRGELACLVSARVETTIRAIRQWERAGLVSTEANGFVLHDVTALEKLTRADDAEG